MCISANIRNLLLLTEGHTAMLVIQLFESFRYVFR